MERRVLLLGHSYVNYLDDFGWRDYSKDSRGEFVRLSYEFISYPGRDFKYFTSENLLNSVREYDPDIVVVIFGGNSITTDRTNSQNKRAAKRFYQYLRLVINPDCLILAVQVEKRYYSHVNLYMCPEPEEYNKKRNILNNYLQRQLKHQRLVDHVIMLGGEVFSKELHYRDDGVHLNQLGFDMYRRIIENGIDYAISLQ